MTAGKQPLPSAPQLEVWVIKASKTRRAVVASGVALLLVAGGVVTATPALAASVPDGLLYAGMNINSARLPAGVVEVEFRSTTPAARVDFTLDGVRVGSDAQLEPRGQNWYASTLVDLRGRQGTAKLQAGVTAPRGYRSFWKTFRVVPLDATKPARPSGAPAAGPDNTGVPAGLALVPVGALRLTQPGQVVEGLDVSGCVVVAANDVTIRNSRIRCADPAQDRVVRTERGITGLRMENVDVDGAGVVDIGVDVSSALLRRLDVSGVNDGVRLGSRVTLQDSWVHGLVRQGSLHPDAVQGVSAQDVLIEGNTLDARSADGKDLGNAAVMLGSEAGTKVSRDVTIRDNFLEGGNFAVNISGSISGERLVVTRNLFGTASRYGAVISPARVPIAPDNVVGPARLRVWADPA